MALHIMQIRYGIVSEFLFKLCFCIFFWKVSLVMTCNLHQWDSISHLSLMSLKLIRVSIKSYFSTVITILLAKTLYPVLICVHPGPRVCWSSLLKFTIQVLKALHIIEVLYMLFFQNFFLSVVFCIGIWKASWPQQATLISVIHFLAKTLCHVFICAQRLRVYWSSLLKVHHVSVAKPLSFETFLGDIIPSFKGR